LSDLQPADPLQPFNYLSLSVLVSMAKPFSTEPDGISGVVVYGSADRPETIIKATPEHSNLGIQTSTARSFQISAHPRRARGSSNINIALV
jgi:hypothetical protein